MSSNTANAPEPVQGGLSQGVVTALAIGGSVLFVLLIIVIILIIILRRMKKEDNRSHSRAEKAQSNAVDEDDGGPIDVTDVAQFEQDKAEQLSQSAEKLPMDSIFQEDKEFNKNTNNVNGEMQADAEIKTESNSDAKAEVTEGSTDEKRESQREKKSSSKHKSKRDLAPEPNVEHIVNAGSEENKRSSASEIKYKDADEYYANSKYAKYAEFKEAFREQRRSRHRSLDAENKSSKKRRRKRKSRRSEGDAHDNKAFRSELKEANPEDELVFVSRDSEV